MNNNNNAAAAEDLSIHRAATFRGKRIINLLNNMYKWIGGGGGGFGGASDLLFRLSIWITSRPQ